ncbi:MAG TPA: DUF3352 domain-containing protein [Solirubrobacteraceae bacterium]|nr:DUF3352 domain-containing protein [Solirubrobacteraceae bacterium]
MRLPRRAVLAAFAAALALAGAVSGCGGSSGSGSADPATLAPASAPLYASVAIKPAGGSGGAAMVAARKLTHLAEPYGSVAQTLLASAGGKLEYKRDVAPWVGERAGVFVTSLGSSTQALRASSLQGLLQGGLASLPGALGAGGFGAHGTQGAIVAQTSDAGAARSFLSKHAGEQGAHAASYRGVSFELTPSGVAEGLVKNFAVVGSESGMHAAIDASLGSPSLAHAPGYAPPATDTIVAAYLKPEALAGAGSSQLGQLFAGAQSATLTATATDSQIALSGEIHGSTTAPPLLGAEGARELGELPTNSWLAAGVGDTGRNLPRALGLLQSVASLATSTVFASFGGPSIERIFKLLASPQAKLQQDFAPWAGAGGMFVAGSGLLNLQAGLVIASKDPAASRAAVAKLGALMRQAGALVAPASISGTDAALSVKLTGFPAEIFIADGAGKFVLGLGQQSVEAAISPSATLSTSSAYSSAAASLADRRSRRSSIGGGIEPSLIVEFPTMLGFLEGLGLTQSPSLASIVPYLKSLGTLTAGASGNGGVQRYKVVLGLG